MIYNRICLLMILVIFIGCKSSITAPRVYGDIDDPYHTRCRLFIKKDNRYTLIYYSFLQKTTGKWHVKNDTLILNSEYKSYLDSEKDSTVHKEKQFFLIRGNKLLHPSNKYFSIKRLK
ncbi:hypothetical protein J2T04_004159 [Chryseobacterium lathyri]|uniref:Lipoprotein n=1 Tax=Chryseobacterium lathyri TaxID=395933 RepID=A0ABT9STV7_9FLAO|nr:hypothetical protein [Chryseobacterium lathyri]